MEVANLAVPEVADWCAVDLATESGGIERKALAHADPERCVEMGDRAEQALPADPGRAGRRATR